MSDQLVEMAENWRNCFEEELICPICLHVFVEPVQLPCKHNFCRGCISEAWAKDTANVRCPECNHAYNQKPNLEKNIKLTNIVEKFNALNVEKAPAVLHCILCRRGPPLQAQKVCLRCNAPCCQSHIQTHLQQPCPAPGHLLVGAEEVRAWSCSHHDEYRLYHCDVEQVAICQYCCFSRCAPNHGHAVCDVEVRRNDIRHMLMKQQDRIDDRVKDIEEQLYKLESDKLLVEDKVRQLKKEVRVQYHKMHQLLEDDLGRTLEVLDKAHSKYCQENSTQTLQLNERRQEAKKLLSSVQVVFDKAEDINIMKNTKPVKILMDRSQSSTGSVLPPCKVGHLNSKIFLSEVSKKEKNLRKILEAPFSTPAHFLQSVSVHSSSVNTSGVEKRKHSTAFPESSTSLLESSSGPMSKQQFLGQGSNSIDGPASQPPMAPCSSTQHIVGLSSSSSAQSVHHSSSVFTPADYPNPSSSQQAMLPQYGGRKILMCTMDNCYCSSVPSISNHHGHPPYPRSGSFPWTQDYTHPLPSTPSMSQPLQGLSMHDWIDASQSHRHPDFYGLYGQSSTKPYVTS
ncbi:probable E3 ubiquitin-protein ligase TRIM8 isoform X2 [Sinocyclocheilus rhinocerous]|uniref:E3 ubiquitin-protein ligase TRIM8 n=1 Tax=Sinocyclocheilus rhinocerous TaxID=307959 RepID=A0A673IS95_9TELE|nr:PREDICTED: probable E3 ubiquitin-protein ligase TRIM8 isoform X1 [Sinocyclocheilus rhinocerous]XP_016400996.1 PREDICTED: probable E3 ubiquitin-protein ligase TRIM8 isoform X2 [Sinocyclocheilus rhinocerous]